MLWSATTASMFTLLLVLLQINGLTSAFVQPPSPFTPSSSCHQIASRLPLRKRTTSRLRAVGKTGGAVLTTAEEFEATVLISEDPIMVFFTAPWCGPCRLSIPVVKEVMLTEYAEAMRVVEVCTDDLPSVASDAGVVSIPTIQMYHNGVVLDTIVGCVAKSVLRTAVEKVLEDVSAKK